MCVNMCMYNNASAYVYIKTNKYIDTSKRSTKEINRKMQKSKKNAINSSTAASRNCHTAETYIYTKETNIYTNETHVCIKET